MHTHANGSAARPRINSTKAAVRKERDFVALLSFYARQIGKLNPELGRAGESIAYLVEQGAVS